MHITNAAAKFARPIDAFTERDVASEQGVRTFVAALVYRLGGAADYEEFPLAKDVFSGSSWKRPSAYSISTEILDAVGEPVAARRSNQYTFVPGRGVYVPVTPPRPRAKFADADRQVLYRRYDHEWYYHSEEYVIAKYRLVHKREFKRQQKVGAGAGEYQPPSAWEVHEHIAAFEQQQNAMHRRSVRQLIAFLVLHTGAEFWPTRLMGSYQTATNPVRPRFMPDRAAFLQARLDEAIRLTSLESIKHTASWILIATGELPKPPGR